MYRPFYRPADCISLIYLSNWIDSILFEKRNYLHDIRFIEFRKKLKKSVNITFGVAMRNNHSEINAFACVVPETMLEQYTLSYIYFGREVEVIQEKLGEFEIRFLSNFTTIKSIDIFCIGMLNTNFYLRSEHYIPQQTIDKINRATNDMLENGWFDFVQQLNVFIVAVKAKMTSVSHRHQFEFEPITSKDFEYLLKTFIICVSFSVFIFIMEIVYYHVRQICGIWIIVMSLGHLSSR